MNTKQDKRNDPVNKQKGRRKEKPNYYIINIICRLTIFIFTERLDILSKIMDRRRNFSDVIGVYTFHLCNEVDEEPVILILPKDDHHYLIIIIILDTLNTSNGDEQWTP